MVNIGRANWNGEQLEIRERDDEEEEDEELRRILMAMTDI